ncbi:MAG: lysylphosphatidylglycerol synthase transmembrane domain-containing protein [Candidatus Eisenbacteria bacterium]
MTGKIIRLIITVVLVGFVISRVDWGEFRSVLGEVRVGLLLLGYALNLVMVALNTWRWRVLVRPLGAIVSLPRLASYYFVCMFFNNFMPTSIGGDVMRVLDLARHTKDRSSAMASIMVERLLGLYALFPIGIVAFAALYPGLPERGWFLVAEAGMAALFLFGTLAIRRRTIRRIEPLLRPLTPMLERFDAKRKAGRLYDCLDAYKDRKGPVLAALLLSLLSRAVWVYSCWVLAESVGIDLRPAHFFLIMPLVEVGRMLPISLSGIGIREGVMILMLRLFGVTDTQSVFLAILIYGIFVFNGLIGGVVYGLRGFFGGSREAPEGGSP